MILHTNRLLLQPFTKYIFSNSLYEFVVVFSSFPVQFFFKIMLKFCSPHGKRREYSVCINFSTKISKKINKINFITNKIMQPALRCLKKFENLQVNPGSKAALRGIREGDLITSINGQSTKDISNAEAHNLLRNAGEILKLGLNEYVYNIKYFLIHSEKHYTIHFTQFIYIYLLSRPCRGKPFNQKSYYIQIH